MSTIASLAGTATTGTSSSGASSAGTSPAVAGQMNTFLKILTTQLQNQNPLSPMDSSTFTSQLVQYSSLEQQMDENDNLKTLTSAVEGQTSQTALNYIGDTVQYTGNKAPVQNGTATWDYSLDSTASAVTLTVTDAEGHVVDTQSGKTAGGAHAFSYAAGASNNGEALTLTVAAANSLGGPINSETYGIASVESVDTSGTTATLQAGNVSIDLAKITQAGKTTTASATPVAPATTAATTGTTSN